MPIKKTIYSNKLLPKSNRLSFILKSTLSVVLIFYLSLLYLHDLNYNRFHIDEWLFIRKSEFFDLFFFKKDLTNPLWFEPEEPDQPKLGPYIYGLTLHLSGIQDINAALTETGFAKAKPGESGWWNQLWRHPSPYFSSLLVTRPDLIWWKSAQIKTPNIPKDLQSKLQLIWTGRKTAVLFSLLTIVLALALGLIMKNFLFAFLAALLIGLNPLMFSAGRRAMTDSILEFAFIANLILITFLLKALKNNQQKSMLIISFLLGLNGTLAVGVKVSGMLLFFLLTAIFLLLFLRYHYIKLSLLPLFLSSIIIAISFLLFFILLHPYLYQNPIGRFSGMLTNRLAIDEYNRSYLPETAINSRADAIQRMAKRMLYPKGEYTNINLGKFPLDALLLALGVFLLAHNSIMLWKKKLEFSVELVLFFWLLVTTIGLSFYLKNDFPRYYLPSEIAITLTQAYAVTYLFQIDKDRPLGL